MQRPTLSVRALLMLALGAISTLVSIHGAETNLAFAYVPYRFESAEQWRVEGSRELGASRLEGRTLHYDFTKGTEALVLRPPDRSFLGKPVKFRLKVRGAAKGHPAQIQLRTHFRTFYKEVGEFTGPGEKALEIEGPPGHGWKWFGGENDGKLHGTLRLGEIRLEAGTAKDAGSLELVSFEVEGVCLQDRLCMMTASTRADGGATRFVVEMRGAADRPLSGTLNWVIRDWARTELSTDSREVTVPESGKPVAIEVPVPAFPANLRFAEAEFNVSLPGQVVPKVQAYWLAPPPPHPDAALRPESPFGMGVYLGRARDDLEQVARLAREVGVKWSREGFNWSRIEPRPGQFDWSFQDRLVDVATTNGIKICGLIFSTSFPKWSKGYTSEGVDELTAYTRQVVARYKDWVKHWEIWNEPNIFFWQGPKELYAECLIKSYKAIKETDPAAEVLGMSTAEIDFKFIGRMLENGAPFDVLTVHPYRGGLDDAVFIDDLKRVSDQVKMPDGGRRPVWLTEIGWSTHVPHHTSREAFDANSQRKQAEYLARTYLCAIAADVEAKTSWYDFRNDGDAPAQFEDNMGIVTRDLRPNPACLAFATMTRLLKGMRFAGPVAFEVPTNVFAFRFEPDPKAGGAGRADFAEVLALWSCKQEASIKAPATGASFELVNTIGEGQPIATSGDDIELSLAAGKPVYLARRAAAPPGKAAEVMERTSLALPTRWSSSAQTGADPALRRLVPARWWESAAGLKVVTLKKGLRYAAEEISLDLAKAAEQFDRIKAEGFQVIEIFAPAEGLQAYNGLDTKNHYRIDLDLGTMDDFRRLVRLALTKGLAVIIFHNVGYYSLEGPDWLEACDLKKAGRTDGKTKWFLWADKADAPPPLPENGIFEVAPKSEPHDKNWGWQYSERAGCYFWARWEAKLKDGTMAGLPQNNWASPEWPEEAARILKTWMDCGIDGMLVDAAMYYPGLTWEKNNAYITDVITKYANTMVQPEGARHLGWITEGNYNCLQDYGLSSIEVAINSGDPRPIEESLKFHDAVVARGGVLYKSTGRSNADAAKRHLARATVAAAGDITALVRGRGGSPSGPDAEETWILKTKFEHPALHNLGFRQKLPTKDDSKHYAMLRTAADKSERMVIVLNFQATPQTVEVDLSEVATAGLTDLKTGETSPREIFFKVELPELGYRFYMVHPAPTQIIWK